MGACCVSRGERHKLSNEFLDKERTLRRSETLTSPEEPVKLIDENPFNFGIQRKKRNQEKFITSATKAFVWIKREDIKEAYDIGNLITKGIYGNVYHATYKNTGAALSVRIVRRGKQKNEGKFLSMIELLLSLDHPNVESLFDVYADDQSFYLVTELYTGGELFERIAKAKHFSEAIAAKYIKNILSGIAYCHNKGVIHRDIKPENILFENDHEDSSLKIFNFGLAATLSAGGGISGTAASSYYIAPEVIRGNYNNKCDVWSCGIILYIMLCGYPPFNGRNSQEINEAILTSDLEFDDEDWKYISTESKAFIKKLLTKDAQERISAQEAFEDPWLKKLSEDVSAKALSNKALGSLKEVQNRFQQLMMSFVATQLITPKQKQELSRIFNELDTDKNGVLTEDEILLGVDKLAADFQISAVEASKLFHEIDSDHSGQIEFGEFVAALFNRDQMATKQQIEHAFRILDEDGNGYLEKKDFEKAMGGVELDDEEWKNAVGDSDVDSDSKISLEEFTNLMLNKKLNAQN